MRSFQFSQKLRRFNNSDSKPSGLFKILNVVSHNIRTASGDSQLQNVIILGVRKLWPPEEVNLSAFCATAQSIQNIINSLARKVEKPLFSSQYLFILKQERR